MWTDGTNMTLCSAELVRGPHRPGCAPNSLPQTLRLATGSTTPCRNPAAVVAPNAQPRSKNSAGWLTTVVDRVCLKHACQSAQDIAGGDCNLSESASCPGVADGTYPEGQHCLPTSIGPRGILVILHTPWPCRAGRLSVRPARNVRRPVRTTSAPIVRAPPAPPASPVSWPAAPAGGFRGRCPPPVLDTDRPGAGDQSTPFLQTRPRPQRRLRSAAQASHPDVVVPLQDGADVVRGVASGRRTPALSRLSSRISPRSRPPYQRERSAPVNARRGEPIGLTCVHITGARIVGSDLIDWIPARIADPTVPFSARWNAVTGAISRPAVRHHASPFPFWMQWTALSQVPGAGANPPPAGDRFHPWPRRKNTGGR